VVGDALDGFGDERRRQLTSGEVWLEDERVNGDGVLGEDGNTDGVVDGAAVAAGRRVCRGNRRRFQVSARRRRRREDFGDAHVGRRQLGEPAVARDGVKRVESLLQLTLDPPAVQF